jgi:rhodanese-related sulfurtransferase
MMRGSPDVQASVYSAPVFLPNIIRCIPLDFFIFASEQWLLISVFMLLMYAFIWRESSKGGKSITYHELTRLINADQAVVLDLRDTKEFESGHIAGAINIPFSKIKDRVSELESRKDRLIVLVDKVGQHSGSIGRELRKQGFNVNRLSGGMSEWFNEKLPTVKS